MLTTVHQLLGYTVALVVLTAAVVGLVQARENRPFTAHVYVVAAVVLDVQVLGGLLVYALGSYWDHDSPLVAFVHPALALLGLAAAHVGLKRARRQDGPAAGHRTAAGGLFVALLAVLIAIAAISAGLRGVGA